MVARYVRFTGKTNVICEDAVNDNIHVLFMVRESGEFFFFLTSLTLFNYPLSPLTERCSYTLQMVVMPSFTVWLKMESRLCSKFPPLLLWKFVLR